MPSLASNLKFLKGFIPRTVKRNVGRVKELIELYEQKKIPSYRSVENAVIKLAHPNLGTLGEDEKLYNNLVNKYKEARPLESKVDREIHRIDEKLKKKRKGVYTMTLILYTGAERKDSTKNVVDELSPEANARYKKYLNKRFRGYKQFWTGQITVTEQRANLIPELVNKLITKKEPRDWKPLYITCMSDKAFYKREMNAPGYLEAIYIMNYNEEKDVEPVDPKKSKKKAGEKMAVQYRYCSNTLDLSKDTFMEAIQKNHYRENECWINALYDHYSDNLLRDNKRRNYISRAIILDLLGKTEESVKEGMTIEEVLPFFQQYKLKLRVFDVFYKLIYKYDPNTPNFNNKPFYCLADGNHIYTLNHDLERLAQKQDEETSEYQVYASPDFKTRDEEERYPDHRMIEHINDIIAILREEEEKPPDSPLNRHEVVYLIHKHDDLEAVIWQLHEARFRPQIKYQAGNISFISLTVNNRVFIIKSQQLIYSDIDGLVEIDTAEKYNKTNAAMSHFGAQLFKQEHKSYYNQQDIDILDEYRTIANIGWLKKTRAPEKLVEIDISKAYTAAFMQIKRVPVFNEFDIWKPYKGEPIKSLDLYIVRVKAGFKEQHMFLNKRHNLCYGQFLGDLAKHVDILAVKQPSFIKKVDYKQIVDELWKTQISEEEDEDIVIKKRIANCNYGMLEKGVNRNQKSFIFDSYSEAKFYQMQYGGVINYIKQYQEVSTESVSLSLDAGAVHDTVLSGKDYRETDQVLYILNLSATASLNNGFRYIKELLLQIHGKYLQDCIQLLRNADIPVYSVKTDAITIESKHLEIAEQIINFEEGIGNWRLSKIEDINFPYELFQLKDTANVPIEEFKVNDIPLTLSDEYDVDKLCGFFEEHRRVMVRAEFAGCGKSYTCKHMANRGHRVLFVCPTNKLASNYGEDGITLNKFFSIGMTEDSKMARFDDSPYDTIVFDEIFFASIRKLARIKHYADKHPEKIVIATGDTNQLETIDIVSNQLDYDEYSNHCINMIFPNMLYLRENKRLKTEEDKRKLKSFKADIFDESVPIRDTVRKYFKLTKWPNTENNIAFKNATCTKVSKAVRKRMTKSSEYEVGEVLVCRIWFKAKKVTFQVNYEYKVTEVGRTAITLDDKHYLPISLVKRNFIHAYCRTCHSFQGSSIDDRITIWDWCYFRVDRKWIYTAVTRATYLDNVFFYDYEEDKEDESVLDSYLDMKVRRYREQDAKTGRAIAEQGYIDKEWLKACFGKSCGSCGDCMVYSIENKMVSSNLTAQRLDNTIGHEVGNVVPWCCWCNCAVSNRD